MLLIDDDEPEARERREDRRARPEHHRRRARAGAEPGTGALAVGKTRVQHRNGYREPGTETIDELRREADLRHEHECLPALRQDRFDRAQVNLRLAATGDAVQEKRPEAARLGNGADGVGLRGIGGRDGRGLARLGAQALAYDPPDPAGVRQGLHRRAPASGNRAQRVAAETLLVFPERGEEPGTQRRALVGRRARLTAGVGDDPHRLTGRVRRPAGS